MVDVVQLSQLNIDLKCDFLEESVIVLISAQVGSLKSLLGTLSQLLALCHFLDFNTY